MLGLAACELVDPEVTQEITPSKLLGGAAGPLEHSALPSQEWRVALPGTPEAIFLERVVLTADRDLSFLRSIRFSVEPIDPASGLGRKLVAWSNAAPRGTVLELETARALDITPWVVEGLRLVPEVAGTVPPADVTVAGEALLQVDLL